MNYKKKSRYQYGANQRWIRVSSANRAQLLSQIGITIAHGGERHTYFSKVYSCGVCERVSLIAKCEVNL